MVDEGFIRIENRNNEKQRGIEESKKEDKKKR